MRTSFAVLLILLGVHAPAQNPEIGDYTRPANVDARLMTWNVEKNFITDSSVDAEFARILQATSPDVIAFQEIDAGLAGGNVVAIAGAIEQRLEALFPGDNWSVWVGLSDTFNRKALATRFPLSMTRSDTTPASEVRGTTMGLVSLPGGGGIYVMTAHMKSGGTVSDHERRQVHADAMINWIRDATTPMCGHCPMGDLINLPTGTGVVLLGDMNLGGSGLGDREPYHATLTLLTGDIFDEATFGPDALPDWDRTPLADAAPYDWATGSANTHSSRASAPSVRLDRAYYTDSVLRVAQSFIVNPKSLPSSNEAGLGFNDAANASDHLPVVMDFIMEPEAGPAVPRLNEFLYNGTGADRYDFVELVNTGGRMLNLDAPHDYHLLVSTQNTINGSVSTAAESFRVDLTGVIPPGGGLHVVVSTGTASGVVAGTVEAILPARQISFGASPFQLHNGTNVVLALVTADFTGYDTREDAVVDALLYEDDGSAAAPRFLTNNGQLISISDTQRSATRIISNTESHARRLGDPRPNDLTQWVAPAPSTPGEPNAVALTPAAWMLF